MSSGQNRPIGLLVAVFSLPIVIAAPPAWADPAWDWASAPPVRARESTRERVAAVEIDQRDRPSATAPRRSHKSSKATVAVRKADKKLTRTTGSAGRGVATIAPSARPHVAPRRQRELFIDRVAASDADEPMPAQPLTPVIRVPLTPLSAAKVERNQRPDSETVSLRATPLEPLDMN
jgi:hypothetical protein